MLAPTCYSSVKYSLPGEAGIGEEDSPSGDFFTKAGESQSPTQVSPEGSPRELKVQVGLCLTPVGPRLWLLGFRAGQRESASSEAGMDSPASHVPE